MDKNVIKRNKIEDIKKIYKKKKNLKKLTRERKRVDE